MEIKQRVFCYLVGLFTIGLGVALTGIAENGVPLFLLGLAILAVTAIGSRSPGHADRANGARPLGLPHDLRPSHAMAVADPAPEQRSGH